MVDTECKSFTAFYGIGRNAIPDIGGAAARKHDLRGAALRGLLHRNDHRAGDGLCRDRVGIGVAAAAADSARPRLAVYRYGHRVVVVGGLRDRKGIILPMRCGSGGVDIAGAVALNGHRVCFDSGCAVGADDQLAGNIFDRIAAVVVVDDVNFFIIHSGRKVVVIAGIGGEGIIAVCGHISVTGGTFWKHNRETAAQDRHRVALAGRYTGGLGVLCRVGADVHLCLDQFHSGLTGGLYGEIQHDRTVGAHFSVAAYGQQSSVRVVVDNGGSFTAVADGCVCEIKLFRVIGELKKEGVVGQIPRLLTHEQRH